jgi:hypothetical protein
MGVGDGGKKENVPISIWSVWKLPQLVSMEEMSRHRTVVGVFMVLSKSTE